MLISSCSLLMGLDSRTNCVSVFLLCVSWVKTFWIIQSLLLLGFMYTCICVTFNLMWIFLLRQTSECLRLSPREVMRCDELLAELCLSVHQNSMIPNYPVSLPGMALISPA